MWMNIKNFEIPNKGKFILGFYENIVEQHHATAYFEFTEVMLVHWENGNLIETRTGLSAKHHLSTATHWMHLPYEFARL